MVLHFSIPLCTRITVGGIIKLLMLDFSLSSQSPHTHSIIMSHLVLIIFWILSLISCVAAWLFKALMAKMLISQLIKAKEEYLGSHAWLLSCRGSVVCFEALIMTAQTYNYELSEVRKLLEMKRQQGSRLLEGAYQSLLLTHSSLQEVKMNELHP